jgi:uncharacterized protein YchJ
MDELGCPCGLGDDYDRCCGRLHRGAPASTADQLMRSRYSAFAESGDAIAAAFPTVRTAVIENRRFVRRATRYLKAVRT